MSFIFRPMLAVAALALATPAFAQVGTTVNTTDKAVTAPATASQSGAADLKTQAPKTDSTAKTDSGSPSAPTAAASTSTDGKSSAKPMEKSAKVAARHHKAQSVKTAATKPDVKSETTTK